MLSTVTVNVTPGDMTPPVPADKVGCVRAIHLKDGGVIRERLIALSDHQHVLTYTILESPLGVHDYVATMHALPVMPRVMLT